MPRLQRYNDDDKHYSVDNCNDNGEYNDDDEDKAFTTATATEIKR